MSRITFSDFHGRTDTKSRPSSRQRWDEGADPCRLDRAADPELAHGHVARAEYLAQRAFALREAAR
jgi:hypothetical protein